MKRSPYRAPFSPQEQSSDEPRRELRHLLLENLVLGCLLLSPCVVGFVRGRFESIETLCLLGALIVLRDAIRTIAHARKNIP